MRYLLALLILDACGGPSEPEWCAVTYYFAPPDSGWTHPDSVDLADPNAPVVEPDSVVLEECIEA